MVFGTCYNLNVMRNVFLAMKKIAAIGACAFLFLGSFSVPQIAFGADTPVGADGTVSASSDKTAEAGLENLAVSMATGQLPFQVIGALITQLIDWVTAGIGWLFLKLLEVLLIPILGYNGFSSSPIISLGWPLVRDVVNMFVVLVLLVIGIGTIVGWKNAHWDQQLPQLFIAIVAVNFSRTLCGLAIDLSQIIMFTFVNSIAQIAAGNFEQLLGFSALSTFAQSFSSSSSSVGVSLTVGALLANAYLRLALHIAVFAVILLLTLAFIWRIVTLWVLVIISPLAFFMQGIQGIYKGASGIWGDWVSRFTAALTLGPMLAFFLWLSLAASSSGSIAQTEAFPEPDPSADSSVGLVLQAFEGSTLASLLLGLVLLIVGMQQAAASASKLGGFAASLINEKMGRRVAKFGLRASDRIGTGLVRTPAVFVGKGVSTITGKDGLLKAARMLPTSLESATRIGYQKGTKKAGSGVIALGQAMGSTSFVSAGGWLQGLEHSDEEKLKKDAKAAVEHMSDAEKLARLRQAIAGEGSNTLEATTENEYLEAQLLSDKDLQDDLYKSIQISDAYLMEARKKYGNNNLTKDEAKRLAFDETIKHTLKKFNKDDSYKKFMEDDKWNKAKSKFIDLYAKVDAGKARSFVDSDKFSGRDMRAGAVADRAVADALNGAVAKIYKDKDTGEITTVTKFDEARNGSYGEAVKAVAGMGYTEERDPTTGAVKPGSSNLVNRQRVRLPGVKLGMGEQSLDTFRVAVPVDVLRANIESGNIDRTRIDESFLASGKLQSQNIVDALAASGASYYDVGKNTSNASAARDAYFDGLKNLIAAARANPTGPRAAYASASARAVYADAQLDRGIGDALAVFNDGSNNYDLGAIANMMETVDDSARHLSTAIGNSEVREQVYRSSEVRKIRDLADRYNSSSNQVERERIAAALEVMTAVIEDEARAIVASSGGESLKKLSTDPGGKGNKAKRAYQLYQAAQAAAPIVGLRSLPPI